MSRTRPPGLHLALSLAQLGWHILPLTWTQKRPLANCDQCEPRRGTAPHNPAGCPCIPAGRWCHGVRAATIDPDRLTAWWTAEPRAVPGVATGPSGLCLIDIDTGHQPLPDNLATHLLPGIDLSAEDIPAAEWNDRARFRDGRDSLSLLARLRGRSNPWPQGEEYRPVSTATPSGGRHLWYRTPAPGLHQVIANTRKPRPYGLAWQVDIKAGWSYGIAPGATTAAGLYKPLNGHPAHVGTMPPWKAAEVIRVASQSPPEPAVHSGTERRRTTAGSNHARAYIDAILANRLPQIKELRNGRWTELSALAFRIGGHLAATGIDPGDIPQRLIDAGYAAGLSYRRAESAVTSSLANGQNRPWPIPPSRAHSGGSHAAR
ncbi:hypothetical protein ABH926_008943 [Catenulispora sp. GP43]|uniref:bifunctional DNA primase/polymerase n=1 Tax=Catenulispora sp. GP43 TaxID=3156263 RepID=UPI003515EA04